MPKKEALMILGTVLSLSFFLSVQLPPRPADAKVIEVRGSKQLVCGSFEDTSIGTRVRRCEWTSR